MLQVAAYQNTKSGSSYTMSSEIYKLLFDDGYISVCLSFPLPQGIVKFTRLVKTLHY